jgi:hypothetical protein
MKFMKYIRVWYNFKNVIIIANDKGENIRKFLCRDLTRSNSVLMMWIRLHLFLGSCYGFDAIHEYVVNNVDEMSIAPIQFENNP